MSKKITPTRLTYFLACISFRPIFGKLGIWYPKTWFWVPKSLLLLRLHDFLWKYFSSLRKRPFKTRSALFEKNNWKNRFFLAFWGKQQCKMYLLCSRISFHQFEALMNLYHHFRVFDHFHRCLVILAMVWYMIREDSIVRN